VVLRGVKVGRVEAIRLAPDEWVEADLRLSTEAEMPSDPVAIVSSASLFGEWQVAIFDRSQAPDDPEVQRLLDEAAAAGSEWPGATLPDIGQLTAQASRIAGDVATVTTRIGGLVDSNTVNDLRQSVVALRNSADRLAAFTERQTGQLNHVVDNASSSSDQIARASGHLEATLSRIDSSTASGELSALVTDARAAAADLRSASADFRALSGTAAGQRARLVDILASTDSVLGRLSRGEGTLGLLSSDSTLYREATRTVVQLRTLLADIQENPRRYFKFSVF
jgi:phospholipid/cholesterol/gamma-HCH transport system substrate-binding protein